MSKFWFHQVERCLFDAGHPLPGVGTKPLRALCLAAPNDIVWVPKEVLPVARAQQEHLNVAGLCDSVEIVTATSGHEQATDFSVLCFGEESHALRPDRSRYEATCYWLNKNNFIATAKRNGWPVPRTTLFPRSLFSLSSWENVLALYQSVPYPIVVKAAVSAGGTEVYRCADGIGLRAIVSTLKGRDFQLQEFLPEATFYGVQYALGECFVTRQLMKGDHYAGAEPVMDDSLIARMRRVTDPVSVAVRQDGIPTFSLDVAVTRDGQIVLLECNPRFGGTTYPWLLAKRLGLTPNQWEYRYRMLSQGYIPYRYLKGLVWQQHCAKSGGAIIIDAGVNDREVGVLFIGSPRMRRRLIAEVDNILARS